MTSPSENQPAAALPPELAQIEAEAAAIEPAAPADPNAPPPPAPVDYQSDAADITSMIFEGCAAFYPSTGQILAPKQAKFAAALGKVMEKRNWSLAAFMGRWGAEIDLAFVGASIAIPLAKAIEHDRAAAKAAEQQAAAVSRDPDPQPERPAGDAYSKAFAGE
jgi:hypothetical protein